MVGQAIQQSASSTFRGLRPFNAARDLRGVALLLERAFREDLGFLRVLADVPGLRNVGAALWAASFAPTAETLLGFVWEEDRQIVGNVTLTPDDTRRRRWMISNVAVDEPFRRRGIARQMMEAVIDDARERGAQWLLLNVRPYNTAAVALYENLGFESIDTEMNYVRSTPTRYVTPRLKLQRLRSADFRKAFDLARASVSEKFKMFRPVRASDFALSLEDRAGEWLLDLFTAQSTERWGYYEVGVLRATVFIKAQRLVSPHVLDIRVARDARGQLETGLVEFALGRLAAFPKREMNARVLTSHEELVNALRLAGFNSTRGLMLMAKEL